MIRLEILYDFIGHFAATRAEGYLVIPSQFEGLTAKARFFGTSASRCVDCYAIFHQNGLKGDDTFGYFWIFLCFL